MLCHLQLSPYFLLLAAAQNSWVNPPALSNSGIGKYENNLIWPIGSQQILVYETNYSKVSLCLYQNGNNTFQYIAQNMAVDASKSTQSYDWTVGELYDQKTKGSIPSENFYGDGFPNSSIPFLFYLFEEGSSSGFGSSYVNITNPVSSSSIASSSPSSTATSLSTRTTLSSGSTSHSKTSTSAKDETATATATTTTATTPTSTPSSSPAAAKSSKLSTAATAGISVAATLASIIALSALALFLYNRHKTNTAEKAQDARQGQALHEVNGFEMVDGMGGELARGTYKYHLAKSNASMKTRFGGWYSANESQELDQDSQRGRTYSLLWELVACQ